MLSLQEGRKSSDQHVHLLPPFELNVGNQSFKNLSIPFNPSVIIPIQNSITLPRWGKFNATLQAIKFIIIFRFYCINASWVDILEKLICSRLDGVSVGLINFNSECCFFNIKMNHGRAQLLNIELNSQVNQQNTCREAYKLLSIGFCNSTKVGSKTFYGR